MKPYVITIDQSTTNTKLFLVNDTGEILAHFEKKHKQIYPQNGWVEHDPNEIYENMMTVLRQAIHAYPQLKQQLAAISITNQRETAVAWDGKTGKPFMNAIVWQCRRTKEICAEFQPYETLVNEKTGLKIDPYFSATKWVWMMRNIDMEGKDIRFGTMDSWLIYCLSKGEHHVCDHTNASRTLLYNLHTCTWDDELMKLFQIPKHALPVIKQSDEIFGYTNLQGLLEEAVPILGVIGDSQSALYAQHCTNPGDVKITLGTGSSVLMNQGSKISESKHGLVTTLAWNLTDTVQYASEAIINSCTDTLNWLRDELHLFEKDEELNIFDVTDLRKETLMMIPAFHGISLPYWNSTCKAAILNISRNTTRKNFLCAGLCSIAFQIQDALSAMKEHSQLPVNVIMADGGATHNQTLMQFLSDVCDCEIRVRKVSDLSAMGAYHIAAEKLFDHPITEAKEMRIYTPMINQKEREELLSRWHKAIEKILYKE